MDKLEYIPGDLVMTNGVPCGTAKDVVYRVTTSDQLDDGTELKGVVRLENLEGVEFGDKGFLFGDCCAWVKDIVPIPLTPSILEKNGWKNDGYDYYKLPTKRAYLYIIKDTKKKRKISKWRIKRGVNFHDEMRKGKYGWNEAAHLGLFD